MTETITGLSIPGLIALGMIAVIYGLVLRELLYAIVERQVWMQVIGPAPFVFLAATALAGILRALGL